jgi:pilus assembly protein CpaE
MSTLEPLASVCDPSTKVVVVGRSNDIGLYRELIRHGISEYLMAPLSSMQVIDAISQLYSSSGSALVGRLITCFGAKGGIGSSTVAHNLAWSLSQEHGISTILVDFDLAFGTAGLDFNQDPVQGVHDALLTPERLDAVLLDRLVTPIAERLSVFAAPATLESDYEFSPQSYETILDVVRASAPVVVVDMPRHWSAWVRQTLGSSSEIVLTAMPDLASLRNAKSVFDVVTASRPNDPMPRVVLNQVGVPKRPEIPTKDFTQALGVEPSLILPFDPQLFGTAANNGQMVAQLGAASRAAEGFRQLAGLVMGRTAVPEPASKTSGLAKIMGAFARKPTKKAG